MSEQDSRVSSRKTNCSRQKTEFGDFQTPPDLARRVCELLIARGIACQTVIEPTCGVGTFLKSAIEVLRPAVALGLEINPDHTAAARQLCHAAAKVQTADFFCVDWPHVLEPLQGPLVVIGNPPWVTSAAVGKINGRNLPKKTNAQRYDGISAITGKSNFDVSEFMISQLVEALCESRKTELAHLAMLCKRSVARRVIGAAWRSKRPIRDVSIHRIDAQREFGASVDACLLLLTVDTPPPLTSAQPTCQVYSSLRATTPSSAFGWRNGVLIADLQAFERNRLLLDPGDRRKPMRSSTSKFGGPSDRSHHAQDSGRLSPPGSCESWQRMAKDAASDSPRWRSGVKHDCVRVMELIETNGVLCNGLGEHVDIETNCLFPMLKSSDLAGGRIHRPSRWMIVTQSFVGEPTAALQQTAPRTWHYLCRHASLLDSRRSRIYRDKPRFSIFGVGPYSFSPARVAVSGFYKDFHFRALGTYRGKPILVDDTCYLIACRSRRESLRLESVLNSAVARDSLSALVFPDAKRPLTIETLQRLNLDRLAEATTVAGCRRGV